MARFTEETEEHAIFRESVRGFIRKEVGPFFRDWEEQGAVTRDLWIKAGAAGLLCPQVPEAYGGPGCSFKYNTMVIEEFTGKGFIGPVNNFSVHSDVCAGYLLSYGTEEQKKTWLPKMVSGEIVCAIAMTEPGTGSDLQAVKTRAKRAGDHFVINGSKTFISNGQLADLVIVVAKTGDEDGAAGVSLILVESERKGFERGRNLEKIGHHSADTSELFFSDVKVPLSNLLGSEGSGFGALMSELPQERLTIAVASIGAAQHAFDITRMYMQERKAFGKPIIKFQANSHKMADLKADLSVGWAFVDQCIKQHERGELTPADASIAKLWCSELQGKLVDQCLQFFGGYGFMKEYEISRLFNDARVQRIYGGTSEIMRELISRYL